MKRVRTSYRRLPLRYKITAAFTLVMAAACALAFVHVPRTLREESLAGLQDKASTIAHMAAFSGSAAIVFADSAGVAEAAASAWTDPDVIAISVVDELGRVLHASRREATGGMVTAEAPVEHAGESFGWVRVDMSTARAERSMETARRRIAVTSTVVFFAAGCVALLMSALITRPLAVVSGAARRIADRGSFTRVDVQSRDEVGALADSFNVMVDRVAAAQAELQETNLSLERRVQERTSELEAEVRIREEAERESRASEHRFRTIFEAAGAGLALLGPDGRVMSANRALQTMLGVPAIELAGTRLAGLAAIADRTALAAAIERVAAGHSTEARLESRLEREGGHRHAICMLSPVRVEMDGAIHVFAVIEDVTEQRELAERYRQSQKLEAIGRLAGGIAHDFNNLLMTINGVCDLVLVDLEDGGLRRDIDQVRSAGERAAQLTRQLLAFSRRQVLQTELVDMNATVQEVTGMLCRVIGETIVLETELDPALPAVRVDSGQLHQVVMNLAVNARDAMPHGGKLVVRTSSVTADEEICQRFDLAAQGLYVSLSVLDTGRGMDAAAQARAFEPFFTTKPLGEGTGLGLSTVYGIVRQSGGGVAFESEPGTGTTFQILLPAETEAVPSLQHPPRVTDDADSGSETVLVAEDEPAVRALVCRVLRRHGFHVLEACDGVDAHAIAAAYHHRIDVLLSDVVMPNCGGPDLAASLRLLRPDMKVVLMSGYTPDDIRAQGLTGIADAVLEKPMTPASLVATIRAVLGAAEREPQPATA